MKNLSAVFMLVSCLITMVCSCEKEGGDIDKKKLEGKWWYAEKKELLFNGEVVETDRQSPGLYDCYEKIYFDSGNLTGARLNGRIIETWGYSIMGDVFTYTLWQYRINKLTRNEFVFSELVNENRAMPDKDAISNGVVRTTFRGKDIHYYDGDKWYYDNNGNIVLCDNGKGYDYSGPWWDTIKYYYSSSKNGNDEPENAVSKGAVDLGIVMTREDGTTYKLYWAKSNLSESGLCANPEDYGDYYAWGELKPKENYSADTYKFLLYNEDLESFEFSKYNTVDNKTVLDPADDVARVKLGGKWRMPTEAEWKELTERCVWTWTSLNGVNGMLVTATNGNSIFLPAAGNRSGSGSHLNNAGSVGRYWSSSLGTDYPDYARYVDFDSDDVGRVWVWVYCLRYYGLSVRPVSE